MLATQHSSTLERDAVTKRLLALRESRGSLPAQVVEIHAEALDVSARTLWRYLSKGGAEPRWRPPYQLTNRDKEAFFECDGRIKDTWELRKSEDPDTVPSLSTLQRAIERELGAEGKAYAKHGAAARRKHTVHLRHEPAHRNARWEADHKQMPVHVLAPGYKEPVKPWGTLFLDGKTRVIQGWAIDIRPTRATVLAALHSAVRVDEDRGPFGGVPDSLRWDRGMEFLANDITKVVVKLGSIADPAPAYSPHLKGKIERLNRTLEEEFVAKLPGFTHGPKRLNGKPYREDSLLTLEEFVAHFDAWVHHYNFERAHSALNGQTPLEAWNADPTPIDVRDPEDLRWLMTASEKRKVHGDGIRFQGLSYIAPELGGNGMRGKQVNVAYIPGDRRRIWVFHDGKFICEAKPQGTLTEQETKEFRKVRGQGKRRTTQIRANLTRKQRALQPMTEPGTPDVAVVIDEETAREDSLTRVTGELRKNASSSLLGLQPIDQPLEAADDAAAVEEEAR